MTYQVWSRKEVECVVPLMCPLKMYMWKWVSALKRAATQRKYIFVIIASMNVLFSRHFRIMLLLRVNVYAPLNFIVSISCTAITESDSGRQCRKLIFPIGPTEYHHHHASQCTRRLTIFPF